MQFTKISSDNDGKQLQQLQQDNAKLQEQVLALQEQLKDNNQSMIMMQSQMTGPGGAQ